MQVVIDVNEEDGMATVTVDGGEPMGPMPAMEALGAIKQMMPAQDEQKMWDEEAEMAEKSEEDEPMMKGEM